MIYTSYFAKLKLLPNNIIPISICLNPPYWYKGLQYKKLAPNYNFFIKWKENHDDNYYIEHFKSEILDNLDINDVINDLNNMLPNNHSNCDIALICYEKSSNFCHRHLVADWLNKNGIECKEWS